MEDRRLLILDDDPMIAATLQTIAEASGFQAAIATEPAEFFDILDRWQPSHVCLDLNMPAMDGVAVISELARRRCQATLIVASGLGSRVLDAAARSAREQGLSVAGVLSKPFGPASLRALLEHAASLPRQASANEKSICLPASADHPDAAELAEAIEQGQIHVVYQPKLHCQSGELSGFEALARWNHPVHGAIPPERFIVLAERSGLIDQLTLHVATQAFNWFSCWTSADARRSTITLAINLSARNLASAQMVEQLRRCCAAANLEPEQVEFELTETAAMENPRLALELLTRLRVHGFRLSLDDFGTGFSSMVQLVRLPFSEIKVDKSFVMTATHSKESRTVIRSIIELARSLGLHSTAEGVEDPEALRYLRDHGCDFVQGFLIARPMEVGQIDEWIETRSRAAGEIRSTLALSEEQEGPIDPPAG